MGNTDFRIATVSGNPEACRRAQKMVEDIVAEVSIALVGVSPPLLPISPGV